MQAGEHSHRQARKERRVFVRDCRGLLENGWLGATLDGARIILPYFL